MIKLLSLLNMYGLIWALLLGAVPANPGTVAALVFFVLIVLVADARRPATGSK